MHITSDQKQKMGKIFKKYGVEFAYLFGSSVTGNCAKASDIDIAVYLKTSPIRLSLPPIRPACAGRRAGRAGHTHQKFGVVAGSNLSFARRRIKQRFETRLKLITELSKLFPKNIDLIVLNDIKSVFFRYVILKEGSLIYTANEESRIDTECSILSDYFDFKPFLEMYNKNFINKKAYAS